MPLRPLETHMHLRRKVADDALAFYAEHAACIAAHPKVGDVAAALVEKLLVGGLDVRVGAEHDLDFTVEPVGERQFFARRFGVEVGDGDVVVPALPASSRSAAVKGLSAGPINTCPQSDITRMRSPSGPRRMVKPFPGAAAG